MAEGLALLGGEGSVNRHMETSPCVVSQVGENTQPGAAGVQGDVCVHVCACVCMHMRVRVHLCVCTHVRVGVRVCVCTHMCVCMCVTPKAGQLGKDRTMHVP